MIRRLIFFYRVEFWRTIVYMLQSTEYDAGSYLRWLWRVNDFEKVMYRRQLVMTTPARLLLMAVSLGAYLQILAGLAIALVAYDRNSVWLELTAVILAAIAPLVWAHLISLPLLGGRWLIIKPKQGRQIRKSSHVFEKHPATKIAIAGSYGKTTMKEMLKTVLGEGKRVAATEANKNVAISHARFAHGLKGDEEILIIEYGEGAPGDVAKFCKVTKPNAGVITGIAPAHLDRYKTLDAAANDIFYLADCLKGKNIFVNSESMEAKPYIKKSYMVYNREEAAGWKIKSPKVSLSGISFVMEKNGEKLNIKAPILGLHQVGPLAAVCAMAHDLGLNKSQIERGASKVTPFEHRMQAYQLSGAWIIDDTYNGNIEGMKAGLELLKSLPAKRKIYVTPGLVDQGPQTKNVHVELGEAIAKSGVDEVVLMNNSATPFIKDGLADFAGILKIEDDPLAFYANLDNFIAAGDLVLMQNDWTDNYN